MRGLLNVPSRSLYCFAVLWSRGEPPSTVICCLWQLQNGARHKILPLSTNQHWIYCRKYLTKPRYCPAPCLLLSVFQSLLALCLLACGTRIYVRKERCVNCFPFRATCLYWDAFVILDSCEAPCPFLALFSISVSSSALTLFSLYFPSQLFFFFTSSSFLYPCSSFFSSLTWFKVRRAHTKRIAMYKS